MPGVAHRLRGEPAGALAEHERLRNRVAREAVGAVRAPDGLAGSVKAGDARPHLAIYAKAAHVVVRDGRDLDRPLSEVDAVLCQPVDYRAERSAQAIRRDVLEA